MKVGRLSYLNSYPVYRGLKEIYPMEFDYVCGTPSELNRLMQENLLDISLVSSIEYLMNRDRYELLGTGIVSEGAVGSVLLFGEEGPLRATNESATSIALLKLLLGERVETTLNKREQIQAVKDNQRVLVIGDLALQLALEYPERVKLDLGEAYSLYTGLPMVFGVFVAKKNIQPLTEAFEASWQIGLSYLDRELKALSETYTLPEEVIKKYLTENISYELTDRAMEGLERFAEEAKTCKNC